MAPMVKHRWNPAEKALQSEMKLQSWMISLCRLIAQSLLHYTLSSATLH